MQKLDLNSLASEGRGKDDVGRVSLEALANPSQIFMQVFLLILNSDMGVFCLHVCLFTTCVQCPQGASECQKPSNWIPEGCGFPCRFWGLNSCLMTEH